MNQSTHCSNGNNPAPCYRTSRGGRGRLVIGAASLGLLPASLLAQNADVQLLYDSRYNQIGSNPPSGPFTNFGQAFLTANGLSIVEVDVNDPLFEFHYLEDPSGTGNFQVTIAQESTRASLMARMPDGEYQFYWEDQNDDFFTADLIQPFADGLWPTQLPTFTSPTRLALSGMNANNPLAVTVNQFVPSPMSSQSVGGMFINVWAGSNYGALVHAQLGVGTGPGGATAITRSIPAGTLQPGTMYWITWLFQHDVNSPGFDGPGRAKTGFRVSTRYAFSTAATPTCPADFNADGIANSADFFDFITAFFGSLPSADVNNDMQVNSQDFFDFLADFFAGC